MVPTTWNLSIYLIFLAGPLIKNLCRDVPNTCLMIRYHLDTVHQAGTAESFGLSPAEGTVELRTIRRDYFGTSLILKPVQCARVH